MDLLCSHRLLSPRTFQYLFLQHGSSFSKSNTAKLLYQIMVTLKVRLLKSFLAKSIGLLGSEKAYPVYFTTNFGIHTFFMKFPIDILVLDNDYKVVKLVTNLSPNRIFLWPLRFDKIIELPTGEIQKNKIRLGDTLKLLEQTHQPTS